jgi:hypothetical protein
MANSDALDTPFHRPKEEREVLNQLLRRGGIPANKTRVRFEYCVDIVPSDICETYGVVARCTYGDLLSILSSRPVTVHNEL